MSYPPYIHGILGALVLTLCLLGCGDPEKVIGSPSRGQNCGAPVDSAISDIQWLYDQQIDDLYPTLVPPIRGSFWERAYRRFAGGVVSHAVGTNDDVVRAGVFQEDFKMVVAGRSFDGTYNQLALARYWPDGSLDTSFDTDGRVKTEIFPGSWQFAHGVDLDRSGHIIAVGRVFDLQSYNFFIARYDSDGALDTDFSSDGWVDLDLIGLNTSADFARDVAIQTDGKVIVAGYSGKEGSYDFSLARFNTNGTLDNTFDTDGIVIHSLRAQDDIGLSLVLQNDEKIIVSGCSDSGSECDFAIARYNTNGSPDTTFETDGVAILDINDDDRVFGVAIQTDNKPVVAGRTRSGGGDWQIAAARFLTTGALDATFDTDGIQIMNPSATFTDSAHSVVITENNRVLIGGRSDNGTNLDAVVLRLTSSGAPDTGFDTDGIAITDLNSRDNYGLGLLYHRDKTLLGGTAHNGANLDFALLRYNSDGSLAASGSADQHFAGNGQFTVNPGSDDDARGIEVGTDGEVLLGGFTEIGGTANSDRDSIFVKVKNDGTLDTSFNTDGIQIIAVQIGQEDTIYSLNIDRNTGRVIGVGYDYPGGAADNSNYNIIALDPDGTLDTDFSGDGIVQDQWRGDDSKAYGVLIQTDSRVVVVGYSENGNAASQDFGISRFTSNGALDATFHTDGRALAGFSNQSNAFGVAIDTAGRYLVTGFSETGTANSTRDFAVVRFLTNGQLDTTYHTDGRNLIPVADDRDEGNAIAIDTMGRAIIVGQSAVGGGNDDYAIVRLTTTGVLDVTFNTDGLDYADLSAGGNDRLEGVVIQPNGKIIAAGRSGNNILLLRYLTTGVLDTTFDTDGILIADFGANELGWATRLTTDGRYVVGGTSGQNIGAYRFWP